MVIHVLDLALHIAVYALAVGAVGKPSHHAQPIGPLLPGKELAHWHCDALAPPGPHSAHHLLSEPYLGLRSCAILLLLPPASLQGPAGSQLVHLPG